MAHVVLKRSQVVSALLAVMIIGADRAHADRPRDWFGGGEGYELNRDDTIKHKGRSSGSVKSTGDGDLGFGTLTQYFRADQYRGKRLRMSAYVKTENVLGWSGLWMRIDGKGKSGLAFDNMQTRPIKVTNQFQKYEIVLDVPEEAESIFFGYLLAGQGQGWVDDITFDVVENDVATTGQVIQPHDMENGRPELPKGPKNLDFEL